VLVDPAPALSGVGSFIRSPKILDDIVFLLDEVFGKIEALRIDEADIQSLVTSCAAEAATLLDTLGSGQTSPCVVQLFKVCDSGLASRVLDFFALSHRSTQVIFNVIDAWWSAASTWCKDDCIKKAPKTSKDVGVEDTSARDNTVAMIGYDDTPKVSSASCKYVLPCRIRTGMCRCQWQLAYRAGAAQNSIILKNRS
jgi:hypothetical protein